MSLAETLQISEKKQHMLQNIIDMNIGYLSINRIMGTLSVFLAEFMAASENTVIMIDEISVGLDPETLLKILEQIKQLGYKNQIWLINHSDTVLDTTDEQLFYNGVQKLSVPCVSCYASGINNEGGWKSSKVSMYKLG